MMNEAGRRELAKRRKEIAEEMRRLKAERVTYTLVEFLAYPFVREVPTRHQGTQYADKLEGILQKIAAEIAKYESKGDVRYFRRD